MAVIVSLSMMVSPFDIASADQFDNQIAELEAQNAEHTHEVDALMLRANNLKDAIRKLQSRINDLQANIKANKTKSKQLKKDIKQAEIELEQQQKTLGQNIKLMYIEDEISTFEMLATSKDLGEFMDKQQYRDVVGDKISAQVEKIKQLKKKLAAQRKEVERLIKEDEAMRHEIGEQKAEQDRLLAMNESEQSKFNAQVAVNNQKIDELRAAQAALAAALANKTYAVAPAGYVNGGAVIGNVGNTGLSSGAHLHLEVRVGGGVTNPGPYIRHNPVNGSYVTQGYWAYNPIYLNDHHPGIDYSRGDGAVRAIDSGNLYRGCSNQLLGTSNNAYGYVAIVEHAGGHISVYAHMSGGPPACDYNTYY